MSGIPSGRSVDPITGTTANNTRFKWGDGFNGQGAIGYGLGNGIRIELEGDYYQNEINERSGSPVPGSSSGHTESYGAMANVYYDLDLTNFGINTFGITPYVGVGGGYQWSHLSPITTVNSDGTLDRVGGTNGSVAFQGIVGVAYPGPGRSRPEPDARIPLHGSAERRSFRRRAFPAVRREQGQYPPVVGAESQRDAGPSLCAVAARAAAAAGPGSSARSSPGAGTRTHPTWCSSIGTVPT